MPGWFGALFSANLQKLFGQCPNAFVSNFVGASLSCANSVVKAVLEGEQSWGNSMKDEDEEEEEDNNDDEGIKENKEGCQKVREFNRRSIYANVPGCDKYQILIQMNIRIYLYKK